MIGIVVVSHSHALAHAAVELASQMVEVSDLPHIAVAAGLDETTLGTDAAAIAAAIEQADSGDGVLVLLDLGSAVLSAEMALELVEPELASRVELSSAALVEGLVAAVVTASGGVDLGGVKTEAEAGLNGKRQHLGGADDAPREADSGDEGRLNDDALTRELQVDVPHGLHARPAARLVACVHRFTDARVSLRNLDGDEREADARSLSSVAALGVRQGDRIQVRADGDDAAAVLEALTVLAQEGFGDTSQSAPGPDKPVSPDTESPPTMGSGLEAALGAVLRVRPDANVDDYEPSGQSDTESTRLRQAVAAAIEDLRDIMHTTRSSIGSAEAEVFQAHVSLLQDSAMTGPAYAQIANGGPAAQAWQRSGEAVAATFAQLSDDYQRERAQDVRSVTNRVLRHLLEGDDETVTPEVEGIRRVLVAPELDPATAAGIDAEKVVGILIVGGGATGHGVLIASARGIPVLTGARQAAELRDGDVVAFDVRTRRVLVRPNETERRDFEEMLAQRQVQQDQDRRAAQSPGQTQDGTPVSVKANVTRASEAVRALQLGAEGSGLVRTELMFAGWSSPPTVQEQVEQFAAVAVALEGHVMTIRTWDVGADKPMAFWPSAPEDNPFLGVRGLRWSMQNPELLCDQLEAVCRVAVEHPVRLMFPMVSTVAEVQWGLDQLTTAGERLEDGVPDSLEVGIMIEVPAAALRAEAMSVLLDFVSIGTNDLTQYTLAAERGNPGVEHLLDPLDPAVLGLISTVCREVAEGVSVGVCGAAASDPRAAALLVGLGVDDLSATPVAVPRVKAVLRRHTTHELQDLAQRALRCDSADEVREVLRGLD